jgi:hypothetical protein
MGPETKLKVKILQWLHQLPLTWAVKIQQVAIRGTPDILACVNGRFIAIELKSEKGKLDPLQKRTLEKIAGSGGISFVVYPDGIDRFKKELLERCLPGIVFGNETTN